MSEQEKFSDEFLNAFVDNQLDPDEKSAAFLAISRSEELNRTVCELRKVRDLVQLAGTRLPEPPPRKPEQAASRFGFRTAAASLLAVGVAIGLALNLAGIGGTKDSLGQRTSALVAGEPVKGIKVMLHLNSGDRERMLDALTEAENLLKYYRDTNQVARVEVVTNSGGLNLLRADTSPDPERIKRLYRDWNNLVFVACQNALDRVTQEIGHKPELLPEAVVVDSAVAQINQRQHQGWAYIQV
jgi:intracellular sulfur oxidation DsrE/DsrF family protein